MKKSWLHQFRESDQWARFKANRLGYWSLWIFTGLFILSLFAELIANDRPILVSYQGSLYAPIVKDYPETTFGGDFPTPTDYLDPDIKKTFSQKGNWAIYPLITYRYDTLNYFAKEPNPASPSRDNLLGTDDRGRDVVARLIYGFRLSVLFGLCLTIIGVAIGVLTGAVMGYFGGKVDLVSQRIIEVWSSMPELYLLIIFASIFAPSVGLLIILLSLFGWMGLSDYVRAEFLKNRSLEYVRAAQALGLSASKSCGAIFCRTA
jgi:microcin C transport system permease protein